MTIDRFLHDSARTHPDREALVTKEGRFTYGRLGAMAAAFSSALVSGGLKKGDRVCILLENSAELVAAVFGVLRAGGAFVLLNPTTKARKCGYIFNDCRASALVTTYEKAQLIAEAAASAPSLKSIWLSGQATELPSSISGISASLREAFMPMSAPGPSSGPEATDLASIIYTSGSTGAPKGVTMAHSNMAAAADSIISYLGITRDDVILNTLPMSFDYGLYQVLMGFRAGARVVLEKFLYSWDILKTIEKERVTGFPVVPTISSILLKTEDFKGLSFDGLRYITNTGAALPVQHIKRLREIFPKTKIFSMYGLTECKRVSYLPPEELDRRPTSVGKPMPNTEAYVVDSDGKRVGPGVTGELVVKGPNVMAGYWGLPEETAKALRPDAGGETVLYTGDLFRTDEDGFLYFVGRKDEILKCRGEKVSPREVEEVIHGHEGVAQAAVAGVPDAVLGTALKAFVVPKKGFELTQRELMQHCSRHLEDFMVPKYIVFMEDLPKNENGKVDRPLLAEGGAAR
ncbi:MAG: AMP-binding protein [Deltaproteobacteria bacterium]|nr:AMP-binding protein [Deltaproteobacteria bacterium]MCL4874142.1 AMP-binding protein [bacterium]